jgi:hypothetical protein
VVLERQGGHLTLGLAFKAPGPVAASIVGAQPEGEAQPQAQEPAQELQGEEPQPQG